MWRQIAAIAWWVWTKRDAVQEAVEVWNKLIAESQLRRQVALALDIAMIAAKETANEVDNQIVSALQQLKDTPLFDTLIAQVDAILKTEETSFRSLPPARTRAELEDILIARGQDASAQKVGLDGDEAMLAAARPENRKPGNPMVLIAIASLVVQVIRWVQERRQEKE